MREPRASESRIASNSKSEEIGRRGRSKEMENGKCQPKADFEAPCRGGGAEKGYGDAGEG